VRPRNESSGGYAESAKTMATKSDRRGPKFCGPIELGGGGLRPARRTGAHSRSVCVPCREGAVLLFSGHSMCRPKQPEGCRGAEGARIWLGPSCFRAAVVIGLNCVCVCVSENQMAVARAPASSLRRPLLHCAWSSATRPQLPRA